MYNVTYVLKKQGTANNIHSLAAYTRLHPLTLTAIYTFFKVTCFFKNRTVLFKQLYPRTILPC